MFIPIDWAPMSLVQVHRTDSKDSRTVSLVPGSKRQIGRLIWGKKFEKPDLPKLLRALICSKTCPVSTLLTHAMNTQSMGVSGGKRWMVASLWKIDLKFFPSMAHQHQRDTGHCEVSSAYFLTGNLNSRTEKGLFVCVSHKLNIFCRIWVAFQFLRLNFKLLHEETYRYFYSKQSTRTALTSVSGVKPKFYWLRFRTCLGPSCKAMLFSGRMLRPFPFACWSTIAGVAANHQRSVSSPTIFDFEKAHTSFLSFWTREACPETCSFKVKSLGDSTNKYIKL